MSNRKLSEPVVEPAWGGYSYEKERPEIFTERGQVMFLSIRDRAKRLLKEAGAFRMQEVITKETGSSWTMIACVDRLVELQEIIELRYPGSTPWGQYRIFTEKYRGG